MWITLIYFVVAFIPTSGYWIKIHQFNWRKLPKKMYSFSMITFVDDFYFSFPESYAQVNNSATFIECFNLICVIMPNAQRRESTVSI